MRDEDGDSRLLLTSPQIGLLEPKYSIQKMQQIETEQREGAQRDGAENVVEGR